MSIFSYGIMSENIAVDFERREYAQGISVKVPMA